MALFSVVVLLLAACGDAATSAADEEEPVSDTTPDATTTSTPATTVSPPSPSTSDAALTAPDVPVVFDAVVHTVDEVELGESWRVGCPVGIEDLRRIEMPHHDDDGGVVTGSLVVHREHVDAVVEVFGRLFEAAFPIHSMVPISTFAADDDASMAANNTSAFNCREIDGRPGVWSQHSFGGAIDINPLVNPWVRGDRVDPPGGADYVDRDQDVVGIIRAGDVVTDAFTAIGWQWGGDWATSKDYQHFSHNGD
ncbi:MAG: hypothetical protein DHS20C19_28840 [Acidimicrobiales bacterium]|nr:MAG: hypothetical protein DHS20C19_28840 [Acidimicrobiales bacterium]